MRLQRALLVAVVGFVFIASLAGFMPEVVSEPSGPTGLSRSTIDPFTLMLNTRDLPTQNIEDIN